MKNTENPNSRPLLLIVAGAKGAVASTVAVAAAAMKRQPDLIEPYLTASGELFSAGANGDVWTAGWDARETSLFDAAKLHGVLPPHILEKFAPQLSETPVKSAPDRSLQLKVKVENVVEDINEFKSMHPEAAPVLVNLLPAARDSCLDRAESLDQLYETADPACPPDLAYVLGAVLTGVPVVNFTPNTVEIPVVCSEAEKRGIPMAGRDGKTGQTYLKVALASALKARSLRIDGWYSLNILGNADGKNLMDPECAAGKVANKTKLLDEILGYRVGENYGESTHKVVIDYYPPRGDAKEAWDVIDFNGLFGLPMSIRVNFQCRDSILAAPMAIDLARWLCALHRAGFKGPVPELGFYFKKPVGLNPPATFQEQILKLESLKKELRGF